MPRANLLEMPVMSIQDGDPYAEHILGPELVHPALEKLLDYHLHLDVTKATDAAVDRLGDMWPIHRDRWLGHYGLATTVEPNGQGREHLIVRARQETVAKIPSGLNPSAERMWLRTNPALQGSIQTVDERFDENVAILFGPETTQTPHPKASLFRGLVNQLFSWR